MNQVAVIEQDAVVATMSRARMALAEAKTIQETKRIVDAAAAAEIYAKRQKLGEETSDLALSIKVEALRKLGEMLKASPKAKGEIRRGSELVPRGTEAASLADLGLTKKESAVAQKLASLSEKDFQAVRDGHVTVGKAIAAIDEGAKPKKGTSAPAQPPAPEPLMVAPDGTVLDDDDAGGDLVALCEELQAENRSLRAQLESVNADDPQAEALRWRKAHEHSVRRQNELMDDAARLKRSLDLLRKDMTAIGRAVGELDHSKIVRAVQSFVRAHREEAA